MITFADWWVQTYPFPADRACHVSMATQSREHLFKLMRACFDAGLAIGAEQDKAPAVLTEREKLTRAIAESRARAAAKQAPNYSFEIKARAPDLGGGWRLVLLENGEEVGGGVFPPDDGRVADVDALQAAYDEAQAEAYAWLDTRDSQT